MEQIIGYILAILVGISLGLIGSGGSILTVPILVYVMHVQPTEATTYSLCIVGSTALVGGIRYAMQQLVDFRTVAYFGLSSIVAAYITRAYIVPIIPDVIYDCPSYTMTKSSFLMLMFAVIMVMAAYNMIRTPIISLENKPKYATQIMLIQGFAVGILTGLIGAGGGFLIIPALVIFARLPMKLAIGTSLMIIAANTLIGFVGGMQSDQSLDYSLLVGFSLASIFGMLVGILISTRIDGSGLKKAFGYFVLCMGIWIIFMECRGL